jgi:hypothetical protein
LQVQQENGKKKTIIAERLSAAKPASLAGFFMP